MHAPSCLSSTHGITGLAASTRYLYACVQDPIHVPSVAVLSLDDLTLVQRFEIPTAGDLHSIWAEQDCLFVVSTATDEVFRLTTAEGEIVEADVYWRPGDKPSCADHHHLNSICRWNKDLIVSGFGPKSGDTWNTAESGFIFNITRGEALLTGIRHPHSLAVIDGRLACCESRERTFRFLDASGERRLAGYTRGICHIADEVFVGSSRGRKISKSTDQALVGEQGSTSCSICRLRLKDLHLEDSIDMSGYATEIYDLLPVSHVDKWPLIAADSCEAADVVWWRETQQLLEDIAALSAPGDVVILVDQDELGIGASFFGRSRLPFPQRNGQYSGPPRDNESAIQELNRLRSSSVTLLVVAWPAFWWLEHYSGFQRHLHSRFKCVLENDRAVFFSLSDSPLEQ